MVQVLRRCLIFLLLLGCSSALFAASLSRIQAVPTKKGWLLRCSLSRAFSYNAFTLAYPDRIVIDLHDTSSRLNFNKINFKGTPIKGVRSAKRKQNDLRLVFDVDRKMFIKAKIITSPKDRKRVLVLELRSNVVIKKKLTVHKHAIPKKPIKTVEKHKKLRDVVVVIDPGHGGKDPGAMGARGAREKNIVLAISKELQRLINREYGMHAVLTRGGDYYISLRQRLRLARKGSADLFVAIHADAYKKTSSRGVSVFVLSERGATSEAAHWLAAQENYSEIGSASLKDKSYWVRSLLIDLSQTVTIVSSLEIGRDILRNLSKIAILHNSKVEQARFVVLKSPDIPSLLIETGFISNRKEEMLLRNKMYRQKLARAILKGITRYFKAHPPEDTVLSKTRHRKIYRVAKGDSLSVIARRLHVSVKQLKTLNRLKSNTVKIGQALRVS